MSSEYFRRLTNWFSDFTQLMSIDSIGRYGSPIELSVNDFNQNRIRNVKSMARGQIHSRI